MATNNSLVKQELKQAAESMTQAANATAEAATASVEATWLQTRAILRIIFIVLGVAAVMWLLYALEGVILLVVLSIFFAYLIAPLVELIHKPFKLRGGEYSIPRVAAISLVYLIIFGTVGVVLYFLIPLLANQVEEFSKQRSAYLEVLQGRTRGLQQLTQRMGLPPSMQDAVVSQAPRVGQAAREYGEQALTSLLGWVTLIPWAIPDSDSSVFSLKDAEGFRRSALQMLPRGRLRWRGDEFFQDVNSTLAAYIRAQLTACLIIGIICTVGFALIGVPYWLALGIIAGLFEFIPLAGPVTVAVLAAVVASFYSPSTVVMVLVFLGVLRVVHDYAIYPRIIGSGIHLHPLAIVLAILCGEELAGLAGIFLAIPAVAIISVTYRHWLEHRGSSGIVADLLKPAEQAVTASGTNDPATSPPGVPTTASALIPTANPLTNATAINSIPNTTTPNTTTGGAAIVNPQ